VRRGRVLFGVKNEAPSHVACTPFICQRYK
jgi:hypothetical protein